MPLPFGTRVLQTIDVALRAGNGIHRPTIVDDSWSITTIEVAIRNGKFTYCRSQIVYESCSSYA